MPLRKPSRKARGVTAQTNAQRQDAYRARKADKLQFEVRGIFAHPDDHQQIKAEAAKINLRRKRKEQK